ncbi:hypothetical protein [Paenibacillus polysaccharolyticus]|uniref:hypothetical protein n=1 Tax=Paenibacillus polysaccharolyticus TaxID=582692 RepID=UPI00300863E9
MGHTFGLFTKSQQGVLFANMRARVANQNDYGNPNHPQHLPESPNAPRSETERHGDEKNPILGDPGFGQIGRWQTVQLDALENSIDQMIEQYLQDKSWYASVRCREALWNMYRRIEWWVEQQHPPDKTQYQRVLQMIKDCIHKILENAQEPGGSHHGVSLPVCPAPYYHHFSGKYFNHFDAKVYEIPLFSMKKDVTFSNKFPDFFRYVSSTEDQEWVTVHSVGRNEQSGSEMILKLNLGLLQIGNSSKITFNWRVKRYGQIRFKYMVSAKRGNGMLFYINGQQVGGEWSENTSWQEAAFTLQPGQMYKFDWLIRKMRPEVWQNNGIYIKDIEVVEIVDTRKPPAPLDRDLDGEQVYKDDNWVVRSSASIAQAHFKGQFITDDLRKKTMKMDLDNECDGAISFAYKMGVDEEPYPDHDYQLFFDDEMLQPTKRGEGNHGSYATSLHGIEWALNGNYSETEADQAKIVYEIVAGPDTTVDLGGTAEVTCPPRNIDHWEPLRQRLGIKEHEWSMLGNPRWVCREGILRLDDPKEGMMIARTEVTLDYEGWFIFSYSHLLRSTEAFQVKVNGVLFHYSSMQDNGNLVRIPLGIGHNSIEFQVQDRFSEEPLKYQQDHLFTYANNTGNTYRKLSPLGSYVDITRGWDVTDAGASTETDGAVITYNAELNPGAKLTINEHMRVYPRMDFNYHPDTGANRDELIFDELFNIREEIDSRLKFIGSWDWKELIRGDGVMWAKGHDQEFICELEANLTQSGYIFWQYGGDFDPGEKLELQVNEITIWTGSKSNGNDGTNCMYPLPPGNHLLRWRYRDGKTYTPSEENVNQPGNGSGGTIGDGEVGNITDPVGERCFPAGSKTYKIDYGKVPFDGISAQSSQWGWSNDGLIFKDGNTHGTKVLEEGKTITRYFKAPPVGRIEYFEHLTVYPLKRKKVLNLRRVSPSILAGPEIHHPEYIDTYLSLNVKGTEPGDKNSEFDSKHTKKIYMDFYCEKNYRVNYRFMSYLVDIKPRARLRVYIYPTGNPAKRVLIHSEEKNRGLHSSEVHYDTYTKDFWNKSAAYFKSKILKVSQPGSYTICIGLTDILDDNDGNKQGVPYHATIGNVIIETEDPDGMNGNFLIDKDYDNLDYSTKVEMKITDLMTGERIAYEDYYAEDNQPTSFSHPYTLEPGRGYRIDYTLYKSSADTSETGLNAGGFTLMGGSFSERWDKYCINAQGLLYREGESPYPDQELWNPPLPGTTAPDGGSHAWLDVIRLYQNKDRVCSDSKIVIEMFENGRLLPSKDYGISEEDKVIAIEVENNSNEKRKYEIRVRFERRCPGDGAMIWGGSMRIEDIIKVDLSWAEVTHFEVWDNKPIWMGGCDNSNMQVKITREDGKVLLNEKYYGDGYHGFELYDLAPKPFSKYKVEITTDQRGKISQVTGKPYLTTFRLHDFKAYERWIWVPEPFDCQLDFFIDNTLIQTFTQEGGYYTFSHPVPKGKHEFKWVFTSMQEEGTRSYEYANLDWMELTNWICDDVYVIPYCEGGGGDQCVEALIKCLLEVWKSRPKMCVIGKRIWLFT